MSQRVRRAWALAAATPGLTFGDRATYAALASFANGAGLAWPRARVVAEMMGADRSAVLRALRRCVAAGILAVEHRSGQTSVYRLPLVDVLEPVDNGSKLSTTARQQRAPVDSNRAPLARAPRAISARPRAHRRAPIEEEEDVRSSRARAGATSHDQGDDMPGAIVRKLGHEPGCPCAHCKAVDVYERHDWPGAGATRAPRPDEPRDEGIDRTGTGDT